MLVQVLLYDELPDQVGRGVEVQVPEPVGVGMGVVLFQSGQQVVRPPLG